MESSVVIREATVEDAARISELLTMLAEEFIIREFSEDGRRHLLAHFDVTEMKARLTSAEYRFHVAECGTLLIAVAGVRERCHLQYLFVQRAHHRAGWARRLWDEARRQAASPSGRYTVNASSYAVAAYERLGFKAVGAVQEQNGVTFQPMEWVTK